MTNSFTDFGLDSCLVQALDAVKIREPTEIQQKTIPLVLQKKRVVGFAETGSGKTAAFLLPILHFWNQDPFGIYAVILTPTRELAQQIALQVQAFGSLIGATCSLIIGGVPEIRQAQELQRRPTIVVATPGRLKALIDSYPDVASYFSLCQFVVFDEADRLYSDGGDVNKFSDALEVITAPMPENVVRLYFSATRSSSLMEEVGDATIVDCVGSAARLPDTLRQLYVFVPQLLKMTYMTYLLTREYPAEQYPSVIMFTSSVEGALRLDAILKELDISSRCLCSALTQVERLEAIDAFRSAQCRVLVATDVASRGLDIGRGVTLVLNYDVPTEPSDYIHRVGRAARAGRLGLAVTIVSQTEVDLLLECEDLAGRKLETLELDESKVLACEYQTRAASAAAYAGLIDSGREQRLVVYKQRKRDRRRLAGPEQKGASPQK